MCANPGFQLKGRNDIVALVATMTEGTAGTKESWSPAPTGQHLLSSAFRILDSARSRCYTIAPMDITWLGHSCFRIKGKETALVTDPYSPTLGFEIGHPQASIITVSHSHTNHSYVQAVEPPEGGPDPKVLSKPGEYEISGVFITGFPSFHDAEEGKKLGKNNVYLLEIEGLALCHLGDLGHPITAAQAKALGKIDVLFVPVGAVNTFDVATAVATAQQLKARVVIPMHYATEFSPKLGPVSDFLKQFGATDETANAPRPRLSVTTASLPEKAQVVLLDYPRKKSAAG